MRARRRNALLALLALLVLVILAAVGIGVIGTRAPSTPPITPAEQAAAAALRLLKIERTDATNAERAVAVTLPGHAGEPAPAGSSTLFKRPLAAHEVVGFVPYYLLSSLGPTDFADATVVVYASLCIGTDGSITTTTPECQNGWARLQSSAFSNFVAAAHQAGDRVLVSVAAFEDSTISPLVAHPGPDASRLAGALGPLIKVDSFDGVNIDIEGTDPSNRGRFVTFVAAFTSDLRSLDPPAELMLDAYAASASSSNTFFDLKRLAPLVDRVFIEAYQMDNPMNSSANSPLVTRNLGYSAVQSLIQYVKLVPRSKLILGFALYGLDFTTVSPKPGALATTASPETYYDEAIATAAHPALWDPSSETPYASFRKDGSWHQLWYDDPVSIALKTALASQFHIRGVGAWTLGMEGDDNELLAALTGGRSPIKLPIGKG